MTSQTIFNIPFIAHANAGAGALGVATNTNTGTGTFARQDILAVGAANAHAAAYNPVDFGPPRVDTYADVSLSGPSNISIATSFHIGASWSAPTMTTVHSAAGEYGSIQNLNFASSTLDIPPWT